MSSTFLWSGSPNQTHKAKVAWKDLCCPREERGLGIRKLWDSSKVFAMSLIWWIFLHTSSLWVSWIQQYFLRYNSIWYVKVDGKGFWFWRKLLKLRAQVYQFLRFEVNDGKTAFSSLMISREWKGLYTSQVMLVHVILVLLAMVGYVMRLRKLVGWLGKIEFNIFMSSMLVFRVCQCLMTI